MFNCRLPIPLFDRFTFCVHQKNSVWIKGALATSPSFPRFCYTFFIPLFHVLFYTLYIPLSHVFVTHSMFHYSMVFYTPSIFHYSVFFTHCILYIQFFRVLLHHVNSIAPCLFTLCIFHYSNFLLNPVCAIIPCF